MKQSSFQVATSHCGLCHYSGYSNRCTFFDDGVCPYIQGIRDIQKGGRGNKEAEIKV